MSHVEAMIFDSGGGKIDDLSIDLQGCLWRLGRTGRATFGISYADDKATSENIRPGNYFLLQFANGLPDWGGVIDFPLSRRPDGLIVAAYEGDRMLDWRVSDADTVFSSTAPGAIAQALVQTAKSNYPLPIAIGDISPSGSQTHEYHYDPLLQEVRGLAAGYDYAVTPAYQDGALTFYLHWYERRGADRRSTVYLIEGHNVGEVNLDEQGPVYNRIIAIGSGVTWADRPVVTVDDLDSRYQYGLREYAKVYLDVNDEATLEEKASALLADMKHPRARGTLTNVVDEDPAGFADYGVGDIVTLQAFLDAGEDWVFDGPVRVLSREWSPAGNCTLEVEEWRD